MKRVLREVHWVCDSVNASYNRITISQGWHERAHADHYNTPQLATCLPFPSLKLAFLVVVARAQVVPTAALVASKS